MPLLEVKDLRVHFDTEDGLVQAVDGISYTVEKGQTLGIVGESGSGKSVSSLTVMGLTRASNARISGEIIFDGKDLLQASDAELRAIRGNDIAMIFQDPLSSLHPFYKVGKQIAEAVQVHRDVSKAAAWDRAVEMLGLVGIPEPRKRADAYPHEFSGGMRQRAMIAMALANDPKLLIADEPTTALDVTVQAQILELIETLQAEFDAAVVIITHDLGVVAEMADEIAVMYAGRVVEKARNDTIFHAPEHPYTWGLLGSIPRLDSPREEELVPIPGRPPSLINLPGGCSFHPRCPYVRDAHRRTEPALAPVDGDPGHQVACLLDTNTRKKLWRDLREGKTPDQARREELGSPVPSEVAHPQEPLAAGKAPAAVGQRDDSGDFGLASRATRLGAAVIDGVLLGALYLIAILVIESVAAVLLGILATLLYAPLLLSRQGDSNGQTLGKQAVGVRVRRVDGGQMTFGRACLREIVARGLLGATAIGALLDPAWCLWDDRKQTLHDKLADTLVVDA